MCVVSLVYDHYGDKWQRWLEAPATMPPVAIIPPAISPEEIDEFRRLLERARKYDAETGQKDCETESKKERLRKLAADLGVRITFDDEKAVIRESGGERPGG